MAGNWKMNLNHVEAVHLLQKLSWTLQDKKHDFERVEVAVLPPFTDIRSVQTLVDGDRMKIKYGAQDVSTHDAGAYTGEISAAMLSKLGCTYVLTGHSERRQYHNEDDALVNAKTAKALEAGLIPIVCVGEGLEIRKADGHVEHTPGPDRRRAGRAEAGRRPQARHRLRAGLGDRHRRGGHSGGRAGGQRGDPGPARGDDLTLGGRLGTDSLRWIGEDGQRRWHHGPTGCRRLSGRGREPPGRRVRRYLPLPGPSVRLLLVILAFSIVVIICSLMLTLLVLLHKGRGGGLSDLFGGGVSSSLGGSSVAERNLDRITIGIGLVWFAAIVALGLLYKLG